MYKKRFLAIATSVVLATALGACGSNSAGGGGETNVTIGATLPMTGDGAAYGKSMSIGLKAALDVLNREKKVHDVHFGLKVTDDQAQPGLAVTQMTQLVNVNNAVAIVSAFTTPPLAQLKPAERYGVPVLNGGGNDPTLLGHDMLYNNILSSTQEEKASLQYAKEKLGVKRVALLIEGDYTNAGIAAVAKVGEDLFPGNSYAQTVDVTTTDPTPYINKALAYKPDAIYVGLPGAILDQTLKQLGNQGVKMPLITASQAFALPGIQKDVVAPQLLISRQAYKPNKTFLAAVKRQAPGFTPDIYTGTYYTLGMQIAEAVKVAKKTGSVDGKSVQKALDSLAPVEGCCGATSFTKDHGTTSNVELVKFASDGSENVVWSGQAPAL